MPKRAYGFALLRGEAVGEFKTVVGLHTLDLYAPALELFDLTGQEIG